MLSDAIARCREHAEFLASHFDKDSEFNWAGKEFASYIRALAVGLPMIFFSPLKCSLFTHIYETDRSDPTAPEN